MIEPPPPPKPPFVYSLPCRPAGVVSRELRERLAVWCERTGHTGERQPEPEPRLTYTVSSTATAITHGLLWWTTKA